jgi:tetratricopeptide (TPR) repeat protein
MKFRCTIVFTLLTLSVCFCASAQQNTEEQAATALHDAEKLLELGKSYEGLAAIDQLITRYPGSGSEKWATLRKQEALYHLARHDEAIALGRTLIEAYQTSDQLLAAWAQCNIGICYMAKQEWQNAVRELQAVEQMNGSDLYDQGPAQGARVRLGEI